MWSEVIRGRRASSIAEAVDIMTALERELSQSDGLWWFNHRGPHRSTFCAAGVAAAVRTTICSKRSKRRSKGKCSTGIVAVVDAVGGEADDAVAMWKVRAARETAWTNAEVLWTPRRSPALHDAFFSRLDSFTGFAGRGLLIPPVALKH